EANLLIAGMEKALAGRFVKSIPAELARQLEDLGTKQKANLALVRVGLRISDARAFDRALRLITDSTATVSERVSLIEVLGQLKRADAVPALLKLLDPVQHPSRRVAALPALQPVPDHQIAEKVLTLYPKMPGELRSRAQT